MNAGADLAKVEYAAVNGMLSTLDPHSILMDPEQARDMDVSTSGKFGGLGIVIRMIDRKLTVMKPMKDTPAWRKGIKAGDHIVKINNESTENLTSNEAVDRLRGEPETGVTLWIERKGDDEPACGSISCATSSASRRSSTSCSTTASATSRSSSSRRASRPTSPRR